MPDFFQTGAVATLHRLGSFETERLERELESFSGDSPIALVLPCHVRDLESPALARIIAELSKVRYLEQVVVGIDGADEPQWEKAQSVFGALPQRPTLLWNDGPRLQALLDELNQAELPTGPRGKGRNVWLCFGYVLGSDRARMVALHDCDIVNYDRELLARLCYPLAHPAFGFDFCKGYYARVSNQLNGRVMRLLVTPMLRALRSILGQHPFLVYLDTFRYPLAGEMSLDVGLVRRVRIPVDWGLEIGVLAEVFRNCAPRAICQSELCENYDHKHQVLSPDNPESGLNRMATDIMRSIFRRMASEGIKLDSGLFETLQFAYTRHAEDLLRAYNADAVMNGLTFPRHEEEIAVATFARAIRHAADAHQRDPVFWPLIPNWNRVESALPDFLERFCSAVGEDADDYQRSQPRRRHTGALGG